MSKRSRKASKPPEPRTTRPLRRIAGVALLLGVGVGMFAYTRKPPTPPAPLPPPKRIETLQDVLDQVDLAPIQPLLETSLTRAALMIGQEAVPTTDVDKMEAYIKDTAHFMQGRYAEEFSSGYETSIRRMNTFFWLDAMKIHYDPHPDPANESCFLPYVIEHNEGTCASMPFFYLAFCEQMGFPVSLVTTQDHFFLRWEDGKVRRNIECTSGGGEGYDEEYIKDLEIPEKAIKSGTYMRSLSRRETVGAMLSVRGAYYMKRGEKEKGMRDHLWALSLQPTDAISLNNLAWRFLYRGEPQIADIFAKEAVRLGGKFDAEKFSKMRSEVLMDFAMQAMQRANEMADQETARRRAYQESQQAFLNQNRRGQGAWPGQAQPGLPSMPGFPNQMPGMPNRMRGMPEEMLGIPGSGRYLPRQPGVPQAPGQYPPGHPLAP